MLGYVIRTLRMYHQEEKSKTKKSKQSKTKKQNKTKKQTKKIYWINF